MVRRRQSVLHVWENVDHESEFTATQEFDWAFCTPVRGDHTRQAVQWKGAADLEKVAGQTVRFRFHLTRGELYAFWVSPDKSGASHGYVAAGGPGFKGPTDTVGG